uniref:Peroxisomal targeting signal 1 receptor n=2 Tax=Triatoma infestans TaxID=30076 RepID=A0A023F139_TRIIF
MSLRKLVEGDCGGANSLVSLTSHFVQDRGLKDEGFHGFSDTIASANSEQLVQEFIEETMVQSTQPFRMDSLLAEMRDLEGRMGPIRSPPVSQLAIEEDVQAWAQQYLNAGKHFDEHAEPGIWTAEPNDSLDPSSDYLDLGIGPKWATEYLQRTQESVLDEPTLGDLSNSVEYIDTKDDLQELAADVIQSVKDDEKFADSKFMKYMKQIRDGDVTAGSEDSTDMKANHWSLEFEHPVCQLKYLPNKSKLLESENKDSKSTEETPSSSSTTAATTTIKEDTFNKQLWSKLSEQWENLAVADDSNSWISEFGDFSTAFKEYKFASENPMLEVVNALEEGKARLEAGDLPSAVLCFEAAVKNEPENSFAWQLLGTTQAENEQDPQAIAALKKCLQLEPSNLTALMALAVSYTNENFQNQACRALKEWLHMNPKYSDLVKEPSQSDQGLIGITSIMTRELHNEVKNLYLEAARRNPTHTIDADVQCGLGVLFNLSGETEMAADCFKAALQAKPNDSRMWNRLGATLANGNRSEEAVDAYRSALQLTPGFIRARYNLGITCVHLGAHREAAEHLLTALNQQASGRGPQGEFSVTMSESIWNTLKLVISLLDRNDLMEDVNKRNLSKLNEEFGIEIKKKKKQQTNKIL